ncbi:hypothetical protein C4544_00180 [candidate division WS5 bacterium]|uniref:NlpC/P60 domain-containing protein n=1 Tax=candidate division WS5 bacterium TaxID=2093353 RepID=A0A419DGX6_9BACT|nr:MAG: hypothetical protein C4544_00180 [candidate division WS5 bacterium]
MVNPPVLASSSSVSPTVKSDDMGAFLFYLFVNKSKACPTSAGGSPGGLPPNCNISGLTPGGKAVCAAEQAAALQKPYIWGGPLECRGNWGSCPQLPQISGFDCSGLTGWAWFQAAGLNIGNVTTTQLANIPNHPAVSDLQPGDLVFFGYGNVHVAIYKGAGKVIHAPQPGDVVREADLNGLAGYFDGGIIGTARPQ